MSIVVAICRNCGKSLGAFPSKKDAILHIVGYKKTCDCGQGFSIIRGEPYGFDIYEIEDQ